MSSTQTQLDLRGSKDLPLYGNLHTPDAPAWDGLVIFAHGFKGYKDYGFIPVLCAALADAGLPAYRFNFSHSGMTHDHAVFKRPDLFEQDTWLTQFNDLHCILRAPMAENKPVILIGHSRGGVSVLNTAARLSAPEAYGLPASHAENINLRGVISLAAPASACNLNPLARESLHTDGRLLSPSGRTGQQLYVGKTWLDEIDADPSQMDPVHAAGLIKTPVAIIHGTADETVASDSAQRIAEAASCTPAMLSEANHVFNGSNPQDPAQLSAATQSMIDTVLSNCRQMIGC